MTKRVTMVAGAACAFLWLGPASAAEADGPVTVEMLHGDSEFAMTGVHPGFEQSREVRVTNDSADDATVVLRIEDLTSDDNGCNRPESEVDQSCGDGEGELGDQLTLTVERLDAGGDLESVLLDVSLSELGEGALIDSDLSAGTSATYRLAIELPFESGNETQTDHADFDVVIVSQPVDASAQLLAEGSTQVLGAVTGPSDGTIIPVQATTAQRLAATGQNLAHLWAGGLAGVAAGAVLSVGSWWRKRRR